MIEVPIPDLLPHQEPVVSDLIRFKLLRCGRRWGKDRLAFHVAWFGHGPLVEPDSPLRTMPGIAGGWDVAWLAPDYPQARMIWQEEIEPRFRGVPDIQLNESEHSVTIPGVGALHLRSSESVDSIRGLGKRLIGVIVNEGAHLDLAYAWQRVIRPTLMDNQGWALLMSTTNSGTDGGKDDAGHPRTPSFFNLLCEEVRAGTRTREEGWAEYSGTAEVNPKILPQEFQAMAREYPPDSTALYEEVYAKLLAPGAGLAFPEWRDDLHTLDRFDVPSHWQLGAGFDWGYWQPSVLTIVAHGEDGRTVVLSDHLWTRKDGQTLGREIAAICLTIPQRIGAIAADSSIWGEKASQGFPNLAEEIQAGLLQVWREKRPQDFPPVLVAVPKGAKSRITRANLLHRYLKWDAVDGQVLATPRLRFLKSCTHCVSSLPKLALDPTNPEDVDTTANDHAYDSLTYFLLSRPPLVEVPERPRDPDVHPGFTPWGERTPSKTEQRYRAQQRGANSKQLVEAKDV